MQTEQISKNNKLTNILWYVLIAELVILATSAYYLIDPKQTKNISDNNFISLYLSYLTVIIFIPLSFWINKKFSAKAKKADTETEKSELFLKSFIIRFAILETAGIFMLVAYYFSTFTEPFYMFAIVFVAALMSKPSNEKFFDKNEDYTQDQTEFLK